MEKIDEIKKAIRLSDKRQYEIAHEAGLHPDVVSKIVNKIILVKKDDPRVNKLADVLGIND